MLYETSIAFVVAYVVEAAFIIIGNAFTIFVFSTQKSHLKRTWFLLINLVVADLLVGITEPIVLGTGKLKNMMTGGREQLLNPSSTFQLFASSTSVFFLALISLERAHAVLWPLRHRVTNTRVYIYSMVIVWAVGFCMFGLGVLSKYQTMVDGKYVSIIIHSCLFISLLVICASCLMIRARLSKPTPELDVHNRHSTENNLRLSRTIFIVIAVSLVFWLPAFVVYTTIEFCPQCFPPYVVWSVNVLHLANSMVNPFVYSFRMPIFREALKKFSRKRRQDIEMRHIQANMLLGSAEGSFTPTMKHTHPSSADGGSQLKLCTEDHHNIPPFRNGCGIAHTTRI